MSEVLTITARPAAVSEVQPVWPAFARVPLACQLSGLSRSGLYREMGAGRIIGRKHNSSMLIDMASVRRFLDSLPAASIRAASK